MAHDQDTRAAGAGVNKRPFFDTAERRLEKVSTSVGLQVIDTKT